MSARRPGPIILISIDTLRADHLPAYGYKGVATPAIDRLAADGVVFEHAYAHAPQTLPSHASILSGELPFEHGVRDNVGFTVKRGQPLIQSILRGHGFATAGFASSFILRKETGISQGFDVYDAETPPIGPNSTFGTVRRDGSNTMNAVEGWLKKETNDRFFLFVHFYEPHRPYTPPARYAHYPNPYDGAIAYSDELVGRLIEDLKARGLYDRSTIVLLSDHGEGLGDHGEQEHGVFLYDSTMRVAMMVKLPGERDAGRRVKAPVEHIDVVPTLLDLSGIAVPGNLRGKSLRAAMDQSDPSLSDRGIYAETLYPLYHFGWSPLYSLTDPRYRFILAPKSELYDLADDASERQNVASAKPQTASSMQTALDAVVGGARTIEKPAATSGTELERFQSLGYIGSAHVPAAFEKNALPDPKDKIGVLDQYRRGIEFRSAQRLPEAEAAFRSVLADNPSMVDVWAQLGAVLLAEGNTAAGADALAHAVNLDPDLADYQIQLASAELTLGRLDDALRHARQAVPGEPAAAHEIMARAELAKGNEAGGLAEARLATQADPNRAFALYVQGVTLARTGNYDGALPLFERAIASVHSRGAELADLHLATADTLTHLNRYEEAEGQFKEEIASFPGNVRARVGLAMLYRALGRQGEAAAVLNDALRLPASPGDRAVVAGALRAMK